MDYVEAASALGEAIRNSVEFQAWQSAELAMLQDEKAQTLMSDFKDLQMKLVHASRDDMDKDDIPGNIEQDIISDYLTGEPLDAMTRALDYADRDNMRDIAKDIIDRL